jgi:hypothetical protein
VLLFFSPALATYIPPYDCYSLSSFRYDIS